ncbi:MAG TPA: hypothetical protein PLF31_01225 [Candidatus Paceibacterota bacterium]|nr:hypothetical protein [Candidatus Paceibacterota bacterium]
MENVSCSIITSLYKTDEHIENYERHIQKCAKKLLKDNVSFEVIAITNDATELETAVCERLQANPWFRWIDVPRETLYATWNRGVRESKGFACTFWNVDDIRTSEGIVDGIERVKSGAPVVYFPFTYKRYVKVGPFKLLAKIKKIDLPAFSKETFTKHMNCGPFFMFSKDFYSKVGPFDEWFTIAGDFEWCTKAAHMAVFQKSEIIGGTFTSDGQTLSGKRSERLTKENEKVAENIKVRNGN